MMGVLISLTAWVFPELWRNVRFVTISPQHFELADGKSFRLNTVYIDNPNDWPVYNVWISLIVMGQPSSALVLPKRQGECETCFLVHGRVPGAVPTSFLVAQRVGPHSTSAISIGPLTPAASTADVRVVSASRTPMAQVQVPGDPHLRWEFATPSEVGAFRIEKLSERDGIIFDAKDILIPRLSTK